MTRQDTKRFGSWAVVTGASSGIGRETALQLAGLGLNAVLVARSEPALRAVASEVQALGSQALVFPCDLAELGAARKIEEACAAFDVGLLVNSAGFGSGGNFLASDLEGQLAMLDVNCRAVLELTHRFARRFQARKQGQIVLLSSVVAFQGVARLANYAATKAFIQSLGEALTQELRGTGVRVLTVIPGPTSSGFAERAKMKMGFADTSRAVARDVVGAMLDGRSRVVPGSVGKALFYTLMTAPRSMRVLIMKAVMGSMTR